MDRCMFEKRELSKRRKDQCENCRRRTHRPLHGLRSRSTATMPGADRSNRDRLTSSASLENELAKLEVFVQAASVHLLDAQEQHVPLQDNGRPSTAGPSTRNALNAHEQRAVLASRSPSSRGLQKKGAERRGEACDWHTSILATTLCTACLTLVFLALSIEAWMQFRSPPAPRAPVTPLTWAWSLAHSPAVVTLLSIYACCSIICWHVCPKTKRMRLRKPPTSVQTSKAQDRPADADVVVGAAIAGYDEKIAMF